MNLPVLKRHMKWAKKWQIRKIIGPGRPKKYTNFLIRIYLHLYTFLVLLQDPQSWTVPWSLDTRSFFGLFLFPPKVLNSKLIIVKMLHIYLRTYYVHTKTQCIKVFKGLIITLANLKITFKFQRWFHLKTFSLHQNRCQITILSSIQLKRRCSG